MKQWQLQAFGMDALALVDVDDPPPPGPGEVTVRFEAASLNYRDVLAIAGAYNPSQKFPLVPLSDGAGTVVAVGETVDTLAVGDRVAGIFAQTWLDGIPDSPPRHGSLGGALPGVAQELRNFPATGLVRVPAHLDSLQAATLPCAAVTAWHALFERGAFHPGMTVLLQGSGGVSLFALQLARAAGAEVIQLTSTDEKARTLRKLGAHHVINYRTTPDWELAVRDCTGGRGVDQVIDVGGPETLPKSVGCTRHGGRISMVGLLSGGQAALDLLPAIGRNIRFDAVFVGSRAMFQRLNRTLAIHSIEPVVDTVFAFDALPEAVEHLRAGRHVGKVALRY